MPAKKKVEANKVMPPKYVAVGKSHELIVMSESVLSTLTASQRRFNDRYSSETVIGIYQLIKVVRRQVIPIEVEEIAIVAA